MITIIAATELNDGIGLNGDLLFKLPKDLKRFKTITSGRTVVMGRKTWESLPTKPLPRRRNIVLTSDRDYVAEGAELAHNVGEILEIAKSREVFIIGGAEIYRQFIHYADRMLLTHIHEVALADTYFPSYSTEWHVQSMVKHEKDKDHEVDFTFATYVRKTIEVKEVKGE